jgi:uncharacterized RDD family membrane protein YckC
MVRYAGFWRRAAAHLIDFVLTNLVSWGVEEVVFGAMYGAYYLYARAHGDMPRPYGDAFDPMFEQVLSAVLYLGLVLPYYIWGTYRFGTTLGKKLLRIRVVRFADNGPVTLKQSVVRCLGYVPSYVLAGCGFFMVAFHPRKLALHDVLAGTASIVVDPSTRGMGDPPSTRGMEEA